METHKTITIKTRRGVEILIDDTTLDIIDGKAVFLRGASRGLYPAIMVDRKIKYLHRLVIDAPDGKNVDHIDGDRLNCTRANLRLASYSENARNGRLRKNNSSGRKGVYWHRRDKKWRAQIVLNGKNIHLGYFVSIEEAAAAYDAAALEFHGDFALTNAELIAMMQKDET